MPKVDGKDVLDKPTYIDTVTARWARMRANLYTALNIPADSPDTKAEP